MTNEAAEPTDANPALFKVMTPYALAQPMNEREAFELQVRKAKVYAQSTLVPQQYQNNAANCMIALNMAVRIKADPLMVMQNLYIVRGKPGWSAQFLIATFNQCGRFSAMRFEQRASIDDRKQWGYRAYATERSTGERIDGPWVTWQMVEAEGWDKRDGSKWLTIPDLMFHYRCGAFLVRTHAPEIAMGLPTVEELRDVIDIDPEHVGTSGTKSDAVTAALRRTRAPGRQADTIDVEQSNGDDDTGADETEKAEAYSSIPVTVEQVTTAIDRADTPDLLDIAEDLISGVRDAKQARVLRALAMKRRDMLGASAAG